MKCHVKEEREVKRNTPYRSGQVVEEDTGDNHRFRRIRTQLLDGSSQSDVTVQDVESLSRDPKRFCVDLCQGSKVTWLLQ